MIIENEKRKLANGISQIIKTDLSNSSTREVETTLKVLSELLDPHSTITESEINHFDCDDKINKIKLVKRTEQITISIYFKCKQDLQATQQELAETQCECFIDREQQSLHLQSTCEADMRKTLNEIAIALCLKEDTSLSLNDLFE